MLRDLTVMTKNEHIGGSSSFLTLNIIELIFCDVSKGVGDVDKLHSVIC